MLIGAGGSLAYGAPSTADLTRRIGEAVARDEWMRVSGGAEAYDVIASTLADYYVGGADAVNFEHIYHCAHELIHARPPSSGAVNEFRPALGPFLTARIAFSSKALHSLIGFMVETVYRLIAIACADPKSDLQTLAGFIQRVRSGHLTRIYTTNYDDFILQALPDLFTGFPTCRRAV